MHCTLLQNPALPEHLAMKDDGSLDVTVYRKPKHTNQYLNFHSYHPMHVKRGLVRYPFDRANVLSPHRTAYRNKNNRAKVLKLNRYPQHIYMYWLLLASHNCGVYSVRRQVYSRKTEHLC